MTRLYPLFLALLLSAATLCSDSPDIERRAAIDVGSGTLKMKVADVEVNQQRILREIFQLHIPLSFQENLEKSDEGKFDRQTIEKAVQKIGKLKKEALLQGAQKIYGVATSAFRNAANGEEAAVEISRRTGVPIKIIDQEEEGVLGYSSSISKFNLKTGCPIVVWDIGGGSWQLVHRNRNQKINVQKGEIASIGFYRKVMREIKNRDPDKDPYPFSEREIKKALALAEQIGQRFTLPQNAVLVGIGSIHNKSIGLYVGNGTFYTKEQLRDYVFSLADQPASGIPGDLPFINTQLTNAILVLGFLEAKELNRVYLMDISMADGILIHPTYWTVTQEKAS